MVHVRVFVECVCIAIIMLQVRVNRGMEKQQIQTKSTSQVHPGH